MTRPDGADEIAILLNESIRANATSLLARKTVSSYHVAPTAASSANHPTTILPTSP